MLPVALRQQPQDGSWNGETGFSDWRQRFGLDESGARTTADAKRPKSSVSERAERVSFSSARVIAAVIFLVRFWIQPKMNAEAQE
jgi:carbohydrate-binding DOMON domain-containing protein